MTGVGVAVQQVEQSALWGLGAEVSDWGRHKGFSGTAAALN